MANLGERFLMPPNPQSNTNSQSRKAARNKADVFRELRWVDDRIMLRLQPRDNWLLIGTLIDAVILRSLRRTRARLLREIVE